MTKGECGMQSPRRMLRRVTDPMSFHSPFPIPISPFVLRGSASPWWILFLSTAHAPFMLKRIAVNDFEDEARKFIVFSGDIL